MYLCIYLFILFTEDFGKINSRKVAVSMGFSWCTLNLLTRFLRSVLMVGVKAASTTYNSEIFWVVQANLSKIMLFTVLGDAYSL